MLYLAQKIDKTSSRYKTFLLLAIFDNIQQKILESLTQFSYSLKILSSFCIFSTKYIWHMSETVLCTLTRTIRNAQITRALNRNLPRFG